VKKKKLFERSEFFFFREKVKILASEREPAVFLFCYLFSFCCQNEKSNSGQNEKSNSGQNEKSNSGQNEKSNSPLEQKINIE